MWQCWGRNVHRANAIRTAQLVENAIKTKIQPVIENASQIKHRFRPDPILFNDYLTLALSSRDLKNAYLTSKSHQSEVTWRYPALLVTIGYVSRVDVEKTCMLWGSHVMHVLIPTRTMTPYRHERQHP